MQYAIEYAALGMAIGWTIVTVDALFMRWFRGLAVNTLAPLACGIFWALYLAVR